MSEVCSQPRVTEVAESTGLRPGWALDLTVHREDGSPWDLFTLANQVAALKLQEDNVPELLIASPMCAAFSSQQNPNYPDTTPSEIEAKLR